MRSRESTVYNFNMVFSYAVISIYLQLFSDFRTNIWHKRMDENR